jgi:hypothetical protein
MISYELAHLLKDAGLTWEPSSGDRFCVPDRDMDDQVFVIADMTVDVHDLPQGRVFGFNGTLEWALDSLEQQEALWLPREDQLREQLGEAFVRLERPWPGPYQVSFRLGEDIRTVTAEDADEAYGRALLVTMTARTAVG